MKSFIRNKKLMAWVVLLTFLFSCVMPSNIMSGNSIAEAAETMTAAEQLQKDAQITDEGGSKTDGNVTVSKTIAPTGIENYFDITLAVDTTTNITELQKDPDMAVVVVMDISNTMKTNFKDTSTSRYSAAMASAKDFIDKFAAANTGYSKIGFVAFNTDAHEVFDLSTCNTEAEATQLKNTMTSKTGAIVYHENYGVNTTPQGKKRFTNIEAGLKMANDMLANSKNSNKYIIFLSDGFPTTYIESGYTGYNVYMGDYRIKPAKGTDGAFYDYLYNNGKGIYCESGTSYSDKGAIRAREMATAIKNSGTKIFSIGIDVGGQTIAGFDGRSNLSVIDRTSNTYELGSATDANAFKNWLGGSATDTTKGIGSGYYYDSTDTAGLQAAYDKIFATITSLNAEANALKWIASDPMPTINDETTMEFLGFYDKNGDLQAYPPTDKLTGANAENGENTAFYDAKKSAISWDMKNSGYTSTVSDSKKTTYHYELTYRVRLKNELSDFVENKSYDTNGRTTLTYQEVTIEDKKETLSGDKTIEFPIPEVKGYLAEFDFTKTDINVEGSKLAGAEFTLTHAADCGVCAAAEHAVKFDAQPSTSDENGKVTFSKIPSGHNYVLVESKAPKGYQENTATYDIIVAYDKITLKNGETVPDTIANTPNTIDISGEKTWDDADNQDGKRPASITVKLLKEVPAESVIEKIQEFIGLEEKFYKEVTNKTVTADDNWEYSFTNLPEYENGVKVVYSIVEDAVSEYTTSYDGYNIKNSYTPETLDISGEKTWDDANDQDGKRPERITVNLLADGTVKESKTVTAADNWEYSFENLPKYVEGKEVAYRIAETVVEDYSTSYDGYDITNSYTPAKTGVTVTKLWVDNKNQDGIRPNEITVKLLANGDATGKTVILNADNNWIASFTDLDEFANGEKITYTVDEEAVTDYEKVITGDIATGFVITNTHVPEVTSVSGTKTWDDANNQDGKRPESITVQLKANDEVVHSATVTADSNGDWNYSFTDLPKYKNGEEIIYTVAEEEVGDYTSEITGDMESGFTITNTHTPETINVEGAKTWADNNNQDGKRPAKITVRLLADGKEVADQKVTAANGWKWSFEGYPKYRDGEVGKEVVYTITEIDVEGYTAEYNGYNITNTHVIEKTEVSVTKDWEDNNNQDGIRPNAITVKLLKNSVDTGKTLTLNAENNWTAEFTGLDKYEGGKLVAYSVMEVNVNGYTTAITENAETEAIDYTITNTHTPEVTSVSGTKTWNDANNQDNKRPESITVNLLADGTVKESKTVTAADNWAYNFENLPKYRDQGTAIVYSITENAVTDYTPTYDGYNITNTYVPETTSVSGTKTWIDNNNAEGLRPSEIEVKLLADGEVYAYKTVTAANNWAYEFKDLPVYKEGAVGQKVVYTIGETAVKDYTSKVDGTNLVNTIAQDYLSIQAVKAWENVPVDADGNEILPNEIVLVVTQDGIDYDTATVTANDEWKYTFANLPKYDVDGDGHKYKYTMYEKPVNGYVPTYSIAKVATDNGSELYQLDITNTYVDNNNVVNVAVNKVWQTSDAEVPAITINLMQGVSNASGTEWKEIDEVVLTNGNTNYNFTNLPKYYQDEKGNKWTYLYKVTEDSVDGYTTSITGNVEDGFTVYNTAKDFGQLVVSKTATGDNKPAADAKYDFVLLIDAGEVDIDLLARQNGMRAEAAKLADEAAAATAALQTAEANFKATTLITTASEYQFIFYNDHHEAMYGFGGTTPGVYDFHTHDHGFVVGVHNDSANILESIIDAIVQAVKNVFARMGSVFDIPAFMDMLEEETSNISTTPSALAFHFGNTVDFMKASRDAELANSRAAVAYDAVDEFDTTTPSAITVTFGDTTLNLTPSEKDQYFNDEAKYYIVPFSLASGENLGFDIEAVNTEGKDTTIKYMVVEQNKYQTDFENTTITVSDNNGTKVLDDNMTAWTELTTGSAYSYAFTNMYSDNTTPPPPGDPEPPTTPDPPTIPDPPSPPEEPEEIDIPEEEVPLAEPGIEIEEPEVPLAEPEVPLGEAPATGDTTNAVPFLCMLLVGLVGFLVSRTKFN